jgi:hypothetical protein
MRRLFVASQPVALFHFRLSFACDTLLKLTAPDGFVPSGASEKG